MRDLTWEEKLAAMKVLCGDAGISLGMRKPGDWYVVASGRALVDGDMLRGEYGNGATPEAAALDDWERVVGSGRVIAADLYGKRRHVQWNGFMWVDVDRDAAPKVVSRG
jgi:hypothetical protein